MRGFSSVARLFGLLTSLADLGTPPPPPKILGTPLERPLHVTSGAIALTNIPMKTLLSVGRICLSDSQGIAVLPHVLAIYELRISLPAAVSCYQEVGRITSEHMVHIYCITFIDIDHRPTYLSDYHAVRFVCLHLHQGDSSLSISWRYTLQTLVILYTYL